VLRVEAWTTVRYLHTRGTSIRAICRELGVSRNTVREKLRRENAHDSAHRVLVRDGEPLLLGAEL
jgi:IS30 family transposase